MKSARMGLGVSRDPDCVDILYSQRQFQELEQCVHLLAGQIIEEAVVNVIIGVQVREYKLPRSGSLCLAYKCILEEDDILFRVQWSLDCWRCHLWRWWKKSASW